MKFDERVAVITGAASGIGRALAEHLAREGCHLALVDRDEAGLGETAARLPARGRRVSLHVVDLAEREALRRLPEEVMQVHSAVHLLLNNAGVAIGGTFEQVASEDFDWLMSINFQAVVELCRGFLPILREQPVPTKIVNLSSLYGLISPPGQTAYSASKFAVRGFSNALRHELRGSSVSVLVVHPGGVATRIADSAKAPLGADPLEVEQHRREMKRLLKMPAERAAQIIVKAIANDRARVLVGNDARLVSLLERLLPVSYWRLIEALLRGAGGRQPGNRP